MKVIAIIPARYESSRFPGKPLVDIKGKAMIQMVYEKVMSCSSIDKVVVATDDVRIQDCVDSFQGDVVMTSKDHQSGTDRIAEAIQKLDGAYDIVINVQGDEPGIDPSDLESLIALFRKESVDIGTLVTPFKTEEDLLNPNRVKAVLAQKGQALYFTRAAAPYHRGAGDVLNLCHQHVGVYAYRNKVLSELTSLAMSPLEKKESLEQLRWLENGYHIHASIIDTAPFGIDTPEDLQQFLEMV